ncbi:MULTISPECIES: cytochrome P450 [unclassified Mycobacterium]|uniref:cytochrome P450 n=2 Tax=Mycobacterium TaxID=1763 RepID=UPI0007FE0A29|nr:MULTISPECIES: cytochrome P450 [unclassified Mycobacterium]OBG58066.1 cytochrome [Mycobacterium sp. E735]OBG68711.1 cytochrome [Mycobacterium sp. E3305]OBG93127.1 cytochrome [Mycobacterium sp. E3298]
MGVQTASEVFYDPYDVELNADPYPLFRRLREEAPLSYNDQHDFYALSRFDDVHAALNDHETFSSARGNILELIKADMPIPPGVFLMEDPPLHDIYRQSLSRMFTPRKMREVEATARQFCAESLDPFVGTGGFDFIANLGAEMPVRVVCRLLGIPDEMRQEVLDLAESHVNTEAGGQMKAASTGLETGQLFADYLDWRAEHPSDDVVTELLSVEFTDLDGTRRGLTREELLICITLVAAGGAETTTRLIGWAGKVLAEHPEQRRELVADRSLIAGAIEELLRFEPPAPHIARTLTRDVDYYGQHVPAGSIMMLLAGAANRDHRQFPPDGDVFDLHRKAGAHVGFGVGVHYCLGASLARMEGRVALDEVLNRFPEWDIDMSAARMTTTSTVRGWETLPAVLA